MPRKSLAIGVAVAFVASLALGAEVPSAQTALSAAAIVDKNVAARGGLQAWRAVQTLSLQGKLGAGGNQRASLSVPVPGPSDGNVVAPKRPADETQLPFLMEL